MDCKDESKKRRGGLWPSAGDPVCSTWCISHMFYVLHLAGNSKKKKHIYEFYFWLSRCEYLLTGKIFLRSGKFTRKTSVLISKKYLNNSVVIFVLPPYKPSL